MKLPFLNKNKHTKEYLITLELRRDSITAVLLEEENGALTRITAEEASLTTTLKDTTTEELIQVADKSISKVEESTPPGTFIKKTLFTVPYEWQEEGKVKKEYLAKLKMLCDELELTPVGFLVAIEAIIHYLKEKDGALASAVFIELDKKELTAFVARGGEIVEIQRNSVEESVISSVENLLRKINSFEVLPQRLIILRHTEANQVQQELVAHSWPQDIPFLHPPQVQVLDKEFEEEAVIKGIADQMKLNIAAEKPQSQEAEEIASKVDAEELGFHKHVDISDLSEEDKKVVHSDNIMINNPQPVTSEPVALEQPENIDEVEGEPQINRKPGASLVTSAKNILTFPFQKTQGIPIGFKVLPVLVIAILIGTIYGYYSYLLKAEVVLHAAEKTTEDERTVVLSAKDATGEDRIKIKTLEIEVEGKKSQPTTGEKITGEKAAGEVTIFNKTENSITLSEGFELATDDGLVFTLGKDVQIASTSAFSTTFSSKKSDVEAETFGEDYNIKSGNNFTVTGYSSGQVFAKNSEDFKGGSRKEIKVASEEDVASLREALVDELTKNAKKQAEKDISSKQTLIPEVLSFEFDSTKFTADVGDEAKSLELSATAIVTLGLYEDNEIQDFVKGISTAETPENYTFQEKDSSINLEDIEIEDDEITALAKIKGSFAPKIKIEELTKQLSRKGAVDAQDILRKVKNVENFEVVYFNNLPFLPEILPWNTNNINVIVKTD